MQEIVVIAIVILAVVYLLFRFKNNSKNKGCDKCCKQNFLKLKNSLTYLIAFVQKISLVFFIYTICRLIFFLANYTSLKEDTTIQEFFYGIRFDFVAIAFLFSPFVLLALLPIPNKENSIYKIATRIIFNIANILSISANLMDSGYFKFSQKRSTADIFEFLGTGNDLFRLLPSYMVDYWYLFATALVLIIGSDYLYKKIDSKVVNIPFSKIMWFGEIIIMARISYPDEHPRFR